MAESYLELLAIENGDIVLRKSDADDNETPLLTLQFSEEVKAFLGDHIEDVVRVMISAGMQVAMKKLNGRVEVEEVDAPTVH